jgi:hypothetical protein
MIIAVILALAAVASLPTTDAPALTGTAGPVNVTVTPTTGLTDGQTISISATMTSGTLVEIRAHICVPGTGANLFPNDIFDFGFQGPFCSKVAPGSGDFQTFQAFAPGTTTGTLSFKAGIGSATWTDEDPTSLAQHTITCDAAHSCELVVQFQNTAGTAATQYFTAPLTYAGATTTTAPGTTTTTAPGTTTTTAPGTTTTTAPGTTTTTHAPTTTTAPGTTTTTHAPTTTTAPGTTTTTHAPTTTTAPATTTTTAPGSTTTTTVSTGGTVSPSATTPGGNFTVTSTGWNPSSQVLVTLHSTTASLGALTADSNGQVSGPFTVPAGFDPGPHTVQLDGSAPGIGIRTVSIPITVAAAPTSTTIAPTATTGPTTGGGTGGLAGTGANSRDLASAALLVLALGVFLLSFRARPEFES